MQFGFNLLMWTDTLNDAALPHLDRMKAIGFDVVEVPVFDLDNMANYEKWGKRFDELEIGRASCRERVSRCV